MPKPYFTDIPLYGDDRGFVHCAMDHMDDRGIKRTYLVENLEKGMVRAWHGHAQATTYMHVISGVVKLAAMKMDDPDDIFTKVCSSRKPELFKVPAGYYNGAMSLTDGTKILVYSTLSFDEVKNDDFRLPWDYNKEIWKVEPR